MIDTKFNITIKYHTHDGELVTAKWNYDNKDCNNCDTCKIEHIDSLLNFWIVTLSPTDYVYGRIKWCVKYDMTICTSIPSNGAATGRSWECSYSMESYSQMHGWTKAYIYKQHGCLIFGILLKRKWGRNDLYRTYNISCRKTNGKSKQKLKY